MHNQRNADSTGQTAVHRWPPQRQYRSDITETRTRNMLAAGMNWARQGKIAHLTP